MSSANKDLYCEQMNHYFFVTSIRRAMETNTRANSSEKEYEECVTLLKEWLAFCDEQSRLHDGGRAFFGNWNYIIAIPAILLSTIGGTANIGISGNDCSTNNTSTTQQQSTTEPYKRWLPIVFGSIGLLSAALFTIHRYMSIPELQKEHDFYSDEYAKLYNEIKMQLFICNSPHKTYINLTEFTKSCKRTLDILVDKEPPIPESVKKKYIKDKNALNEAITNVREKLGSQIKPTTPPRGPAKSIPSLTLFQSQPTQSRRPNVFIEIGEPERGSLSSTTPHGIRED